jgi:hypothetical protein
MKIIRDKMKAAQDQQKCYAYIRRMPLKFNVEDVVYFKVAP